MPPDVHAAQLAGRVVREKVGDDDFLDHQARRQNDPLGSSALGWKSASTRRRKATSTSAEKITLNLVIAFGVRDGYLMITLHRFASAVWPNWEPADRSWARPEMGPLKKVC